METINQLILYSAMFFLIFARLIGAFIITPVFSSTFIPNQVKLFFVLILSLVMFNLQSEYVQFELNIYYIALLIKELSIGFALGFVVYLYLSVFNMAGEIIDGQIGFSMVSFFDPMTNTNDTITGTLYYTIATLVLFLINGHHWIIQAILESFKMYKVGMTDLNPALYAQMLKLFIGTFALAFKIASPIVAALFIANVTLGFLAKTVPQMNVFVVGMPLKVAMGFAMLIILTPLFIKATGHVFEELQVKMIELLHYFGT